MANTHIAALVQVSPPLAPPPAQQTLGGMHMPAIPHAIGPVPGVAPLPPRPPLLLPLPLLPLPLLVLPPLLPLPPLLDDEGGHAVLNV